MAAGADRNLSRSERLRRILERDGADCVWCRRPIDTDLVKATTEHLVPRIRALPPQCRSLLPGGAWEAASTYGERGGWGGWVGGGGWVGRLRGCARPLAIALCSTTTPYKVTHTPHPHTHTLPDSFLTGPKAYSQILARLLSGARKDRFVAEE